MTSDGISTADWDGVHERALNVVNARDDDALADHYRLELLEFLDSLDRKYGELPSLLATRADYVEDPRESERLLFRAYDRSLTIADEKNALLVALSLVSFYANELRLIKRAEEWLVRSEKHLSAAHAHDAHKYEELRDQLRSLKVERESSD
jgi:hypothetical protein